MADRNFTVRLSARVDAYVAAIKHAERETHNFSRTTQRNMGHIGRQMQNAGRMMTMAVTVPLLGLGAAAIKSGVDWESAFTGVRKTVDGTATELSNLESELRGMTSRMPASHKEIAAVAEAAGQLGIKVGDIAAFTEVMVKLGDTTNVIGQEGAINMARFMNIMQTAPSRINEMGAVLVHLGNNTATTEAEILELSTRIAGAGKIAGLSEADVMSLAAAITSVGVKAEAGGTATSKFLLMMHDAVLQGGEKLKTLSSVAGMEMEAFSKLFEEDAAGAFAAFIQGLGEAADSGQSVTPIFEALGVADERLMRAMRDTANAGPLLAEALELGNTAAAEGTALNEEAAKRYETVAAKLGIFRNKAVDLGIDLSEILIPVMLLGVDVLSQMVGAFDSVPRPIQAMIMVLAGLVAAAGPAIWVLGTLIRNIQTLSAVIAKTSMKSLITPLGGVLLAAGAVAATFAILKSKSDAAAEALRAQEQAVADLTARLNQAPDPLEVLAQDFRDFATENDTFRKGMLETGTSFEELAAAAAAGPAEFSRFKDRLEAFARASGMSRDEAHAFGQELEAQRVIMIRAYDAAGEMVLIQEASAEATGDLADETEIYTGEVEEAETASDRWNAAIDALIEKLGEERDALQDSVDALEAKISAFRSAADATFALHDAEDAYSEAVDELNTVLEDSESTLRDIQQAQDAVAESARDTADAHVRLAEDQAILEGRTLTATEKLDIFNNSLLTQAANAEGPARTAIVNYIAELNGIPEETASHILTLLDEGKVEEAESVLAFTSRNRNTTLHADADAASLADADAKLDYVSRNRSMVIDVRFGGPGGHAANQFLDRGGMGYPGDIVAEQGPEFVDGKLVAIPTMLTRPARVVGREDTERILESQKRSAMDGFTSTTLSPIPYAPSSSASTGGPVVVEVVAPSTMTLNVDGKSMTAHVEGVVYERERKKAGAL